jgi:hypothetical protein
VRRSSANALIMTRRCRGDHPRLAKINALWLRLPPMAALIEVWRALRSGLEQSHPPARPTGGQREITDATEPSRAGPIKNGMLEAMYRPEDVHRSLRLIGPTLIGLVATLVCLTACGDRVVVARELSLRPDAAASAPDAGEKTPSQHNKHSDDDDDHDGKDDTSHP